MGIGTRIFLSLFFLVFLGIGCFFTFWMARGAVAAARTYGWEQTSCRILESRVIRRESGSERPYLFEVLYRYRFNGREHESRLYESAYRGSDQISDAQRLSDRYPAGTSAVCYVDPAVPGNACLVRPGLWMALAVPLPLVFVLVGAGGIVFIWRTAGREARDPRPRAISQKAVTSGKAAGCVVAFLSLFVLAGAGTSLFFIRPALRNLSARSWPEVPCVVVSSEVRTHKGDDGATYSADILYEYEVGGRTYRSNRYQFLGGSSSGYKSKARVVKANPPGTRRICWVDPADPTNAVLSRSFGKEYWFALVPFLFMAAGLGGIHLTRRGARQQRLATATAASFGSPGSFAFAETSVVSGPVVLKSAPGPVAKLVGTTFAALFWNGIVSVFVWQMIKAWRHGDRPYGLTLFLVPFVLVGLVLIGSVGYYLLALFNPRPRMRLSRHAIPLGGSASLDWTFSGVATRMTRVKVEVEGREEARYTRGTTTYTDRSTFVTIPVFDAPAPAGVRAGHATFTIPTDAMHSFSAPNNRIVWTLKLTGEIPNWPDVSEEFQLDVRPRPPGEGKE